MKPNTHLPIIHHSKPILFQKREHLLFPNQRHILLCLHIDENLNIANHAVASQADDAQDCNECTKGMTQTLNCFMLLKQFLPLIGNNRKKIRCTWGCSTTIVHLMT
jgi:hypothetical protein